MNYNKKNEANFFLHFLKKNIDNYFCNYLHYICVMNYQTDKTMNLYSPYTKQELDKIGNAIIYLAGKIPNLSKTKLLKLIFLIEETSIKKYGLPIFNLPFLVWKYGPVAKDIYVDLSDDGVLFNKYISTKQNGNNTIVSAKIGFSDDEFSDNEIKILDLVVDKFGSYSAEQLVTLTHREHSLWYITAKENGVLEYLQTEKINNTNIEIDLSRTLENDSFKKEIYLQHREFLTQSRSLKF